jgi:hypothetical protein
VSIDAVLGWTGATLGGGVGWWAGARGGMFTAFVCSMVGTGVGLYLGRRLAASLLG